MDSIVSALIMRRTFSLTALIVIMAGSAGILPAVDVVNGQGSPKRAIAPAVRSQSQSLPTQSSLLEQATIDEINLARTHPADYLKFLEDFKKNYRGREVHFADGSVLVTNEGVAVLDEAIAFMRGLKPVAPLTSNVGMARGATDHLNDLVKTGGFGHKGSDGSLTGDRLDRYGRWLESLGEDIVYQSRTAREDVISLIVDDGTSTRGHRKNIFNPQFRVVGIARSKPLKRGTLCVITFAGGYKTKPGL
jgi:uncharacterized protein YkwD